MKSHLITTTARTTPNTTSAASKSRSRSMAAAFPSTAFANRGEINVGGHILWSFSREVRCCVVVS
jgi:hypothetical protein